MLHIANDLGGIGNCWTAVIFALTPVFSIYLQKTVGVSGILQNAESYLIRPGGPGS